MGRARPRSCHSNARMRGVLTPGGRPCGSANRLLVQRLHIADYLPKLLIGKFCPRRHTLPHIPIYQQPMQIALCCLLLHPLAFQRRTFPGPFSIFSMALRTAIKKNLAPRGNRVCLPVIRAGLFVITGRTFFSQLPSAAPNSNTEGRSTIVSARAILRIIARPGESVPTLDRFRRRFQSGTSGECCNRSIQTGARTTRTSHAAPPN